MLRLASKWFYGDTISVTCVHWILMILFSLENGRRISYPLLKLPSILNDPNFKKHQPTVFYAHGFLESLQSRSVNTIIDAYSYRGGWNLIVIDWSRFAAGRYLTTVLPQTHSVGLLIAQYLTYFMLAGVPADKIHLVGHSLGGQLVGLLARIVRFRFKNKVQINRVTALDPAGPGFEPQLLWAFDPISASDG
jgi:pimeloyl-ACP methyl ester carboxylesterase